MKKFLFLCLILTACAAGSKRMDTDVFCSVDVGASERELKAKAGSPYNTKNLGHGEVEYEYIERVIVSDRTFEIRHYYFILKNGKVTSKKVIEKQEDHHPLLERNAYDMQTSFK